MKKTASLFMALVMVFALAIPVFAQQADTSTANVTATGTTLAVAIKVKAPTSASLILNPYKMKYTGSIEALANKQDQVMSPQAVFENSTTSKLKVTGTFKAVTTTVASVAENAVDSAETGSGAGTAKKAFVQVKFGMMKNEDGTFDETIGTTKTYPFPAFAKDAADTAKTITLDKDITTDAAPKYVAYTIPETDGETPNYFGFEFTGKCTSAPTEPWASTDTFGVEVALKFTPVALTVSGG